jgi:hypothetical protein
MDEFLKVSYLTLTALHKKRKSRQRQLADGSDPIYKECAFFVRRGAPEGFRNPINEVAKPGFDLLPPARFARFSKEVSSS